MALTRAKWADKMDNLAESVAAVDRQIMEIAQEAAKRGPLTDDAVELALTTRYLLRQVHRNLQELRDDDILTGGWD